MTLQCFLAYNDLCGSPIDCAGYCSSFDSYCNGYDECVRAVSDASIPTIVGLTLTGAFIIVGCIVGYLLYKRRQDKKPKPKIDDNEIQMANVFDNPDELKHFAITSDGSLNGSTNSLPTANSMTESSHNLNNVSNMRASNNAVFSTIHSNSTNSTFVSSNMASNNEL